MDRRIAAVSGLALFIAGSAGHVVTLGIQAHRTATAPTLDVERDGVVLVYRGVMVTLGLAAAVALLSGLLVLTRRLRTGPVLGYAAVGVAMLLLTPWSVLLLADLTSGWSSQPPATEPSHAMAVALLGTSVTALVTGVAATVAVWRLRER